MNNIAKKIKLKLITKRGYRFELAFLAVSVIAILCCMLPALRNSEWPTGTNFEINTKIQAEHFKQGDIFPVWSADDSFGDGSPLPLYYHKTFYYVAGTLLLITNAIKLSILMTIGLFMLIGVYGMRFCLRKFTDHSVFTILASQTLLFANYTFTDWLVRDDMAEFAAMMLIPWMAWWCLRLLKDRKFSLSIAPILFLLLNAHNIVGLFGLILPLVAYAVFLLREKSAGLRETFKPLLKSVGILIVLMLPLLIIEKLFLKYYNPSKVTQAGYSASNNFHLFTEYLYHRGYVWLNAPENPTIQIDLALTIPALLVAILTVSSVFSQYKRTWMRKHIDFRIAGFLLACLAVFMFLQLRISKPLYEHLHFMEYLQFPWRLLSYITIILILLIAYVATRYKNKLFLNCFAVLWLVFFILSSPAFKVLQHNYVKPIPFRYDVPKGEKAELNVLIGGIGEYLPRVYNGKNEMASLDVIPLFSSDHKAKALSGGPCTFYQTPATRYEQLETDLSVNCDKAAKIALPVSYNDFTEIKDSRTGHIFNYTRTNPQDPRIIISVPAHSNLELNIKFPTVPRIIKKLL